MLRRNFLILAGTATVQCAAGPIKAIALEIYSYEDAIRLSKESGIKVYVLFVGKRCEWCERQKEVITDHVVVERLKSFLVAYVDVGEERDVARNHKIRVVPTHLIIEEGEASKKFAGYQTAEELLKWLD